MINRRRVIAITAIVCTELANRALFLESNAADLPSDAWLNERLTPIDENQIVGWHVFRRKSLCCGFVIREKLLEYGFGRTELEIMIAFSGVVKQTYDLKSDLAHYTTRLDITSVTKNLNRKRFLFSESREVIGMLRADSISRLDRFANHNFGYDWT